MTSDSFDLNDIDREPSDEQLSALMECVAMATRQRAGDARVAMMQKLDDAIADAWKTEWTGRPAVTPTSQTAGS